MAKISKTRRSADEEGDGGSILDHFPGGAEPEPTRDARGDAAGEDIEALKAKISELMTRTERLAATNLTLMSQPAPSQPAYTPPTRREPVKVDMSGLPDVTTDPEGYNRGLNERIQRAIDTNMALMAENANASAAATRDVDGRVSA